MNKTLAYLITDDFCFKAKKDGIVEKIDTKNKVAILKYNDNTYDSIDLDDKLEKNSNMGFYIHCKMKIVYKEGESFKKDDVIAFMPEYFSGKGKNIDYHPGALAKVAIASGDFSFEDSTIICETLGKKCEARINMLKDIALEKNTIIHKIVKAGDHVVTGDSLLEYTAGYDDPDTADFLLKLGSAVGDEALDTVVHDKITTMYTGEVTDVEIFYNCPFEELSPSLQALIKEYKKNISDRNNAVAGKNASRNVHVPPLEQVFTKRIGTKEFPADGGVIINIYVEYIDEMGMGDKLTYSTALKGVISKVLTKDEAPLCDYRPEEPIEAILTPTGIISRMTSDIYSMLFGNKVLVELGKQIRRYLERKLKKYRKNK